MAPHPPALRIHTYRDPVIREIALPWEETAKAELSQLTAGMRRMMHALNGIGIAGNQIGVARRLFVYASQDGDIALINPRIIKRSLRKESAEEGCLSVPGVFGLVKRFREVEIEAQTEKGKPIRFRAKGMLARVMQHELDHLNGTLFIDRATRFTTDNAASIQTFRRKPARL